MNADNNNTNPSAPTPDRRHGLSVRGMFRPTFTFTIGLLLFFVSSWFVHLRLLAGDIWFNSWMSAVVMMVAFFFGERSALKSNDPELERRVSG